MKIPIKKGTQTEIDDMACGVAVRNARRKTGHSLFDLAYALGIKSISHMSQLELGKRKWTEYRFDQAMKILSK